MTYSDDCGCPFVPAPIWRRVAAAVYDGLLMIALWLTGTLISVVAGDILPKNDGWTLGHLLQPYYFIVGLAFFGWFWTHGGQTPGMRAWRLRLHRDSFGTIRWPIAAVRYTAMLGFWGLSLLPLIALIPALRAHLAGLATAGWIGLGVLLCGWGWALLDRFHRSPQDIASGTVTVTAISSEHKRRAPALRHNRQPKEADDPQ